MSDDNVILISTEDLKISKKW